uniref:Geranylgeranyl transferase type-2 subunit beta n=2 Tax=Panagrolaimus sp. JU765 TaxID=591449 RepID=A0AC34QPA9_9BILA
MIAWRDDKIFNVKEIMSLASIWNIARRDVPIPANSPDKLLKEKHAEFILKYGKTDNLFEYVMSEHLRLSGLYWCLTALDIMGDCDKADIDLIISVVQEAKNDDGGYGGAKNHESHVLHTLCAVQVLLTLNKTELIDVDGIVGFIKNLQQEDGSFNGMPKENDNDTRFSMCALATLYLLNKLDEIDVEKAVNYVLSCYNFDGGFGTYPKSESHAGQIYCCLGVLAITNNLQRIDTNKTARWLAERQCPSGGLCGRPEKLPDVCYSWWVLASLAILNKQNWIDKKTLVEFILASQDDELGGIADRPGDETDPFHTVFGLAGLSIMGFDDLSPVDPVFCMTRRALGDLSFITKTPKQNPSTIIEIKKQSDAKIHFL